MRPSADTGLPVPSSQQLGDGKAIKTLLPYVLKYPFRVALAMSCLILAKVSNIGIPVVLKHLIDDLTFAPNDPKRYLIFPLSLILAYGLLRLSSSIFTELREFLFAKVTQNAIRQIAI